jgi:hypothetical protein
MPAFGVEADMTLCGKSAFAVAVGVKQTWALALHMSAFDQSGFSEADLRL